jgi:ubiquitin-conjugating enzyme E2 variant
VPLIEAFAVLLLADAVSGLIHWAQDTFWSESTPIVGRWIVQPNVIHHRRGTRFVSKSWLESSWDLLAVGFMTLVSAWALGCLTWHVWLFVLLGVNANQIHKWNHMPRHRVPLVVRALQSAQLLQTMNHHALHHRGTRNTHYCVITPLLNRTLDRAGFWRFLERVFVPFVPTPRRNDLHSC